MRSYFSFSKRSAAIVLLLSLFVVSDVRFLIPQSVAAGVANVLPDEKNSAHALRSYGDYRRDLKAFMKNSKRADEPEVQRAAVFNLCQLHDAIVADPRFETTESFQGLRIVAAQRLKSYAKQVQVEQLRRERATKAKRSSTDSETAGSIDTSNRQGPELAGTASDFPDLASSNQSSKSQLNNDSSSLDEAYEFSSQSYYAMGSFSGGPAQLFNYTGGNFAPPWDHGPELVALIENTINPAFWRRNGGPGAIHYFQPLRVLVITASADVHDRTQKLLQTLRIAGQ